MNKSLRCVTYNQYDFQQLKLSISMTSLLNFSTCLVMLFLLVYLLDYLWMTSILFDKNIYCRFFSISRLVNWVISDPLVHKGLKKQKSSHIVHILVGLIIGLLLLKKEHMVFLCLLTLHIFTYINAECKFLDSHEHFVILINQTCQL